MKLRGGEYLRGTVGGPLRALCTARPPPSYELDPARAAPGDDVTRNGARLAHVTAGVWAGIAASASQMPRCAATTQTTRVQAPLLSASGCLSL
jgi:hypothetical protein